MGYATKKQLDYAKQISTTLGISLPTTQDFDVVNKFISDNRQDFYKLKNQQIRDTICSTISIVSIASELGLHPVRKGKYYSLQEHDSVIIDTTKNCYWQNSKGRTVMNAAEGGSVIDFMKNFTNRSIGDIMRDLSNRVNTDSYDITSNVALTTVKGMEKESGELVLPPKSYNMRRVYAYLLKSRYIRPEVVQDFVNREMLYQDTYNNCVFVSKEDSGKPIFATLRGTNTEKRFVGDVKNCDYSKGFYINNNADKTIVTESVIDAMSVMNIILARGEDIHNYNYMPLAGVTKFEGLINQIKEHPVRDLYLALDNDKAGIENIVIAKNFIETELGDIDININECIPEYTKDWNDEIKYALNHGVDCAGLDFFHDITGNEHLEKLRDKLKKTKKDIEKKQAVYEYSIENEIEM